MQKYIIKKKIRRANIANGNYNSSNGSSNNGNLLPEYIKEGITLGGVTGTLKDLDTSDATATAEDDFGKGRENTATMIAEWNKGENGKYGQQNTGTYDDVWVANNSLGSITASVVYNVFFVRLATTF